MAQSGQKLVSQFCALNSASNLFGTLCTVSVPIRTIYNKTVNPQKQKMLVTFAMMKIAFLLCELEDHSYDGGGGMTNDNGSGGSLGCGGKIIA